MKRLILLLLLLSPSVFAQTDPSKTWTHMYWYPSVSLSDQFNFKMSFPIEFVSIPKHLETSLFSISMIKQENKYYFSSNPLYLIIFAGAATINNSIDKEGLSSISGFITSAFLAPQLLTNFKFGCSPNDNIAFLVGQHTDYYLFYKTSRICTESSIGIKLSNESFRATIELHKPWTKGYYANKDPHLNIGLSYFSNFPTGPW